MVVDDSTVTSHVKRDPEEVPRAGSRLRPHRERLRDGLPLEGGVAPCACPGLRVGIPLKLLLVSSLLLLIPWLGPAVRPRAGAAAARGAGAGRSSRPRARWRPRSTTGRTCSSRARSTRCRRARSATCACRTWRSRSSSTDGRTTGSSRGSSRAPTRVSTEGGALFSFRYRVGRYGTGVYVLFEVQDDRVVLRDPRAARPRRATTTCRSRW